MMSLGFGKKTNNKNVLSVDVFIKDLVDGLDLSSVCLFLKQQFLRLALSAKLSSQEDKDMPLFSLF